MTIFDDIYNVLQEEITPEWICGRTVDRSGFDLKHRTLTDAIQTRTGSDIEAQFWMSNNRKNLNFEFANRKEEHVELRVRLAASLRTFTFAKDPPPWLEPSTGSTVCKVKILDKNDALAKSIVKEYFRFIAKVIAEWSSVALAALPANVNLSSEKIPKQENLAKELSITRMVKTALATVDGSNGQQVLRTLKNKELRLKQLEFKKHIEALVEAQNGCCAISDLPLLFDGQEGDKELLCSLDRIDSDGHYETGNLQVVCRFVNRWKSDGNDSEFRRLLGLIRGLGQ